MSQCFSKRNTRSGHAQSGVGAGRANTPARLFVMQSASVVSLHMASCTRHNMQEGECITGRVCVWLVGLLRELLFKYCPSPGKGTSL